MACKNCGSEDGSWNYTYENKSAFQEGRLRTSDVSVVFYFGCNECSETHKILSPEKIVKLLNGEN